MADLRASHVALPRERRMYAVAESAFATFAKHVGADAFRILNGVIGSPVPNRVERVDNRQTRSIESQITGSTPPMEWSAEGYLIPSGAAGTAPDIGAILLAAFGDETNTPATSHVYNPSDTQGDLGSLQITDEISAIVMETLLGAWVEELTLRGSNGDPPQFAASGAASKHILTGRAIVTTVAAAVVTPDDINHVEIGSVVQFLDVADGVTIIDDNSSAGFKVLSKTSTTYTVDASPVGVSPTDIIAPFSPTEVTAGDPATGIVGSLVLDSEPLNLQSWELTLKNNLQAHADEAFQANATGYHEDNRQVNGQITMRAHADQVAFLTRRKTFGTFAMTIIIGATAGSIITITFPTVELGFANLDKPTPESALITLPFKALGTMNEISLSFT